MTIGGPGTMRQGMLEAALEWAALADRISVAFFRDSRRSERCWRKRDGTLVGVADVAVERALRAAIGRRFPDDDVVGEEDGRSRRRSPEGNEQGQERVWLVDPVDGTSSFLGGGDDWGTHVALVEDGVPRLGVITRPLRSVRHWAVAGGGVRGRRLSVAGHVEDVAIALSSVDELSRARVCGYAEPDAEPRRILTRRARWITPAEGAFHALLRGDVDIVLDDGGRPWDMAPRVVMVREAGGAFSDPAGGDRLDLGGGVYCNRSLLPQVRQALRGAVMGGPPPSVWR